MSIGTHTLTLPPGTATLTADANGVLRLYPTTFYPSSATPTPGAVVTLRAGEERLGVDVQLEPVPAVRVSGKILAPGEYGAHVPVRLLPAPESTISIPELETAATITDAEGAFTFPVIPSGHYVLRVVRVPRPPIDLPPSTAPVVRAGSIAVQATPPPTGPSIPPPIPADATLYADADVVVGDADVAGVTLALRPGPRVSGRMEFDGTGDRPDPVMLANARITLDPADASRVLPEGLGFATGRIDDSGQFHTYGVPPGRYFVRVGGLTEWFFKSALYEGRDVTDHPIDLTSDLSGLVLVLTDRPSSVAGIVRSGQRLDDGAVVLVFPQERDEWEPTGTAPRRFRTARANADGSYLLPSLPPGDYYLVAVHETFEDEWKDPEFLDSLARVAERVSLVEGERRRQDLRTIADR
jgi:hypothetical protein